MSGASSQICRATAPQAQAFASSVGVWRLAFPSTDCSIRWNWRCWSWTHEPDLDQLPHEICHHDQMSLPAIRTQIDNGGAIVAANDSDSDIASAVRDTHSYVWPRDGALVAQALRLAGEIALPRSP